LFADLADADNSELFDILSNGFKLRAATSWGNISSSDYIYAAFAEAPINYARAR